VDGAGSVETTRVRNPCRADSRPNAAVTVVLPTPPFPPKKRTRRSSRGCGLEVATVLPSDFVQRVCDLAQAAGVHRIHEVRENVFASQCSVLQHL